MRSTSRGWLPSRPKRDGRGPRASRRRSDLHTADCRHGPGPGRPPVPPGLAALTANPPGTASPALAAVLEAGGLVLEGRLLVLGRLPLLGQAVLQLLHLPARQPPQGPADSPLHPRILQPAALLLVALVSVPERGLGHRITGRLRAHARAPTPTRAPTAPCEQPGLIGVR